MKTIALIAIRLGSSRLPGKGKMPVLGKPVIERMIERIRCSRHIDDILIATTTLESDNELERFSEALDVQCYRGAVDDVLGRMNAAVASTNADLVVEMLGDNPLVHSDLIDDVVDFYHAEQVDYAANVTVEYPHAGSEFAKFPVGIRVQVFTPEVLAKCDRLVTKVENREHSTSFIYENPKTFKLAYFEARDKWSDLHRPELTFAVNYRENFELIKIIFEHCYPEDKNFSLQAALEFYDDHPELASLMGAQE
jgi:spore coat polysaccharide biosynthesis protein SpsF